jgi:hypothetical protein
MLYSWFTPAVLILFTPAVLIFMYMYICICVYSCRTPALLMLVLLCEYVCVCVCVCGIFIYKHTYVLLMCALLLFPSLDTYNCSNLVSFYIHLYTSALLVLYSLCMCVCVPAYWPSRVCGGKVGAEERWSMGAWRVAAEGSWSSTATPTASCLFTDACRCCAGTYSPAGAAACVACGAGERDTCCSRVI